MRAHTITTQARVGARGRTRRTIVPRGILALSLAVALVAATASTASTTPTPSAPPLTLGVSFKYAYGYRDDPDRGVVVVLGALRKKISPGVYSLKREVTLKATTSNDSTLVARGDVKRTTKQLAAGERGEATRFTAKLKRSKWEQLKEELDAPKPVKLRAKIKFKATDEFGQTVTDEFELRD
jgi:hypothetical protein